MNNVEFDELRGDFYRRSEEIADEGGLVELLHDLAREAERDLVERFGPGDEFDEESDAWIEPEAANPLDPESAKELLASIEAWASVASHAAYQAKFGPVREVGAMRERILGFGREVEGKLTELVNLLGRYAGRAMLALHAEEFTISTGFPWGFSVGLSWSPQSISRNAPSGGNPV